jgi:hypothetical protein
MKKILLTGLVILIALGGLAYWQYIPFIERQVESAMRAQGLENVKVDLARAGLNGAVFKEIRFGDENPVVLENVTLNYTLSDLRAGRLNEILLESLSIIAIQQESGWIVYGLEGLKTGEPDPNYNPLSVIPINQSDLNAIPFRRIAIKNSDLELRNALGILQIPVDLEWVKASPAHLLYQGDEIKMAMKELELNFLEPRLEAALNEGLWSGNWRSLAQSSNPLLPAFDMAGTLEADQSALALSGNFKSHDDAYKGDFTFDYAPSSAASMVFKSTLQADIKREGGLISMPLSVNWTLAEGLSVEGENGTAEWQSGENSVNAQKLSINVQQNEDQSFTGTAEAGAINLTAPIEIPTLKTEAKIVYKAAQLDIIGQIFSADKSWLAHYAVTAGNPKPSENGLRIKNAKMPWNNGRILAENIWYPFTGNKAVPIRIEVENVDLAELMNTMTVERLKAQGAVSGFIDVEISPAGEIMIKDAELSADGPGTITMPPEMIPAQNEQVNLVKDIMDDLHFKVLNMNMVSDGAGNDVIKLSVEGNNPKVYDGHPVKLNINLTGNLIDFAEQNIMLLTRPGQFLRGNQNDNQE